MRPIGIFRAGGFLEGAPANTRSRIFSRLLQSPDREIILLHLGVADQTVVSLTAVEIAVNGQVVVNEQVAISTRHWRYPLPFVRCQGHGLMEGFVTTAGAIGQTVTLVVEGYWTVRRALRT